MSEALIGLAGVIVGAALTGLVDLFKERVQERATVEGNVRVLTLDLVELDSLLHWSLEDDVIRLSPADVARTTDTWLKCRDLLARKLDSSEWAIVARVFQTTLVWAERNGEKLQGRDREYLQNWLTRIEQAQDILDHWPDQSKTP